MTPEQLLTNLTNLLVAMMGPAAILAAIVGTAAYGFGKAGDSPHLISWGKNAWLGAIVLFGGSAVIGILRYVAGSVFGGVA